MGSLRGQRQYRLKKEFPETPGVIYCYDILVLKYHCTDALGTLAYALGEPLGFKLQDHKVLELVNLKVLLESIPGVLNDECEGEWVEHWPLPKEEHTYVFNGLRLRDDPECYENSFFPVTYTFTTNFDPASKLFLVTKEREPEPFPKMVSLDPWDK